MNRLPKRLSDCIILGLLHVTGIGLLQADPFLYQFANNPPDVLLGFRQVGGSFELVANVGPASLFYDAAPGSEMVIGAYDPALLSATFSSLNTLSWSVSSAVRYPEATCTLSKPFG